MQRRRNTEKMKKKKKNFRNFQCVIFMIFYFGHLLLRIHHAKFGVIWTSRNEIKNSQNRLKWVKMVENGVFWPFLISFLLIQINQTWHDVFSEVDDQNKKSWRSSIENYENSSFSSSFFQYFFFFALQFAHHFFPQIQSMDKTGKEIVK